MSIIPILLLFMVTDSASNIDREILWVSLDERLFEHTRLLSTGDQIIADGIVVRLPAEGSYRLRYTITCDSQWRTKALEIHDLDLPEHRLELQSDGTGNWRNRLGEAIPSLKGCRDIDIYYSPFTNTL